MHTSEPRTHQRIPIGAALLLLAACATSTADNDRLPKTHNALPPPASAGDEISRVAYACTDGSNFGASFDDNKGLVIVTPATGAPVTLYIAATSDGFAYMDKGLELRGKGDNATWVSAPNRPAVNCTVKPGS